MHGSAPDIAGSDQANPFAAILSTAMMLRYSLGEAGIADRIEGAVATVLDQGLRSVDLLRGSGEPSGTEALGDAVIAAL